MTVVTFYSEITKSDLEIANFVNSSSCCAPALKDIMSQHDGFEGWPTAGISCGHSLYAMDGFWTQALMTAKGVSSQSLSIFMRLLKLRFAVEIRFRVCELQAPCPQCYSLV